MCKQQCNNEYHKSAYWDAYPKDIGLIYDKFAKLHNDRFLSDRLQCLSCMCGALLGFTVTLQSHCVPGCPPVSQWLEHSGSVCQLVDICLLPPPSVVMAANPPYYHHLPPRWPAFSALLSCFLRTPAVNHLCLSCSPPHPDLSCRPHSFQNCTLLQALVCWTLDTWSEKRQTETGYVPIKVC